MLGRKALGAGFASCSSSTGIQIILHRIVDAGTIATLNYVLLAPYPSISAICSFGAGTSLGLSHKHGEIEGIREQSSLMNLS